MAQVSNMASGTGSGTIAQATSQDLVQMLTVAHMQYSSGRYTDALSICETIYSIDAYRTENLLLLGAIHFQLRNFSECIFYNQQCIRVDPNFAEAYSNLGNALKELGDLQGSVQFYHKSIKLKPRFCDAYNNLALAHMQLGQPQQAIETYQMALVLSPHLVDAHCNLGNLHKAQGNLELAKQSYLQAIQIRPDFAIAWSNLAGVFKDEGQLATAIAYYREAIRLCPQFADAYSNLGNALKEQGLIDQAMGCYNAALTIRPDFAIAHGNLASCYYDKNMLAEAIKTFKYAIQLEPNFPDAYNNLGNALRESSPSQLDEAIYCYRTALRLKPDHPHAYNNLGNAMKDKGRVKEAIHCYVTAARLMPRFAAAHSNLGSILKEQGKLQQAIAHYHEAVAIDPLFADAYSNMGNAYKDLGRLDDAIKCYTAAIRLQPQFADAYSNLASAYKDGGYVQEAITCYRKAIELKQQMEGKDFPDAFANLVHSLLFICDWESRDENMEKLKELLEKQLQAPLPPALLTGVAVGRGEAGGASAEEQGALANAVVLPSVQPFHALVYEKMGLNISLQIAQRYAARALANVALLDMPAFRYRSKKPEERLHVGYVSSDLGNHPLCHLTQSLFGMHDRSRVQVTCYALTSSDMSVWRKKVEGEAECFRDISALTHDDAARLIHSDGVHVLVNLNGYTKGARNEIFALRPAPIQISYMGFCGTMGAEYIQYMIADPHVIPREDAHQRYYSEKIAYMPHSYFVNDHRQSSRYILDETDSEQKTRADYGVPEDKFVYCNFNQLYKIDPAIFDVWCSVLKRVENSILWLLRFPPAGEANIRAEARKRGVKEEQIFFSDVAPKEEHIRRGKLAEVFLDTPQCNAHTTGCDILWSGTPLITVTGGKMATRVATSLLHAAELGECVCSDLQSYEELAVDLAVNDERYMAMRSKLEINRETLPLFDTRRWVRNMEEGLHMMWNRYMQGLEPDHIDIPDVVGRSLAYEPPEEGELEQGAAEA
mmetsp:Transcript_41710/g.96443  ORF Transcript_41710/g.96443 Transcript_41710/m.96443 type:complete len:999 (+) Transcript_41710:300-3296(+)|eukprot:CAMPEP_0182573010 /NCGR_PEP_ID=MMETSP1324-20130603/18014_1 /TAXON_ID=236786 /ORGANISM="Florenciella sp., Strain RCC1587" /LENGTH=998 /DNA_ID=CAMNT_0024788049 /DNA_START=281 /DNA_END=3277 /DNA_ORIENTATION=+